MAGSFKILQGLQNQFFGGKLYVLFEGYPYTLLDSTVDPSTIEFPDQGVPLQRIDSQGNLVLMTTVPLGSTACPRPGNQLLLDGRIVDNNMVRLIQEQQAKFPDTFELKFYVYTYFHNEHDNSEPDIDPPAFTKVSAKYAAVQVLPPEILP